MYVTDFPTQQSESDLTLIGIVAAVRAKSSLSQPARVDLLCTQGLDALLEETFGHALINPELDAALEKRRTGSVYLERERLPGYQHHGPGISSSSSGRT